MSKNTDLGNLVNGLFVNSSGNVGVKNTNPTVALDVTGAIRVSGGSAISTAVFSLTGNDGGIDINNTGTLASGRTSQIRLVNGTTFFGANDRSYQLINTGTSSTASDFYIQYFNGSSYFDRFRIASTGNVGIGTSSPVGEGSDDIVTHIHNPATSGAARAMIRLTNGYTGSAWGNGSFITVDSAQGLYIGNSEAAPMLLFTSGTERMRILSNGNIGIGTSSPTSIGTGYTTVDIRGTNGGGLNFGTTNAIGFIYADGGALDLGTYSTQIVRIYQSSSLRFMVASNGNILIGTQTDNGYKLNVSGNIYSSGAYFSNSSIYASGGFSGNGIVIDYGYVVAINSNNQNAANGWYMQVSTSWSNNFRFFYGGTGVGSGSAKFQIDTGGGYTGISDINKKKDIALSTLGLAEVMQLKPSTFKFKDDENQEEQIGFIAQEVKDIIPHAYYEDKEGDDKFIGLKQAAFIPVLVKAIQELKAEIETLKNK